MQRLYELRPHSGLYPVPFWRRRFVYRRKPYQQNGRLPINLPDVQPSPKCESCIGNPIYPSTGQKVQVETDYAGLPGLTFDRTYRSNLGYFASITNSVFVDYSLPRGTATRDLSSWFPPTTQWIWTAGTLLLALYQRRTAPVSTRPNDGRELRFSGPNAAVTQSRWTSMTE